MLGTEKSFFLGHECPIMYHRPIKSQFPSSILLTKKSKVKNENSRHVRRFGSGPVRVDMVVSSVINKLAKGEVI